MIPVLRSLLLAAALLFSQHAAMLHGLAHAQRELELAQHDGKAPALDHSIDVCAAFGALAYALGNAFAAQPCAGVHAATPLAAYEIVPVATRIVFDSRAPPLSV